MAFVKKENMKTTEDGRPCTDIGTYRVIKNSEHMSGVYIVKYGELKLITSKPNWSQAVKLANLLNEAYEEGLSSCTDSNF